MMPARRGIDSSMVIVTGASGWLGRSLLPALCRDGELPPPARIRCLVTSQGEADACREQSSRVEAVIGDIRDPVSVDRLLHGARGATVFHTASVIHAQHGVREFFDVNVGGTALLLDRSRRAEAERVVFVSSNSPFGFNTTPAGVFDETSPYRPYLSYGRSKMEAEGLVHAASRRGDVGTVVVRCPWFYGPHQPQRQTRFFSLVRQGRFPLCGDGTNRRSMVYIENLVDGLLRAGASPRARGRDYWIADAQPYTMLRILDATRDALATEGFNVASRHLRLPGTVAAVARAADRALQAKGRYVQGIHVLGEVDRSIACSIERARLELGYEPEVAIEEGMRRSVRWCVVAGHRI
jgi:nucleoside-diphosphate-sugar epimerase